MWKTVKLGDVCTIYNGGTPKSKTKSYWEGDIKWLTPKDMGKLDGKFVSDTARKITHDGLNNSSAKLVPANSVILSCRAPIGHVFVNECDMSFNQGCKGLVPSNEILVEFLYYFLFSSKQLLNDLGTGTTFKEISSKTLSNVFFSFPSLAEQERIVAKLDTAFAEIDKTVSLVQNKIADIQSLNNALLANNLSNTKNTEKLGDVIEIARGGSPRPIKSFITTEDDGVNWIKIGDTEQGGKYISTTKEKIKPSGVSRSRYVKENDFLLSNSMSFGRPYILKTTGCIHDGWLVLSKYQESFIADYLYYLLSSSLVQNQFENLARGSTVRNLNIELVSEVIVPILPLTEQQRVVAKLDVAYSAFEMANDAMEKSKRNYQALKSAILSKELQSSEVA